MGESSRARSTLEWARHGVTRVARNPASGLVVIAPLVLAGAVAAAPNVGTPSLADRGVIPAAAVVPDAGDGTGPAVVSVSRAPSRYRVSGASISAPPAIVVSSPGTLRIPTMALSAYRNAERMMALAAPGCGVSWNLLAGIGRIESMHANGGATDAQGTAVQPIYGPALDGSLPGNEVIVQSRGTNGRLTYARAMGPMQFLPGTWARYAADGDGDGKADPQNLFDSTLAAARYLCSGGLNLREQQQVMSAILRYNNSMPYTRNVLGWAAAYATGVVPVNLPPITGSAPSMSVGVGDAHLEASSVGLGPGLPVSVLGLSPTDPFSQTPLINFGSTDVASQLPNPLNPATAGPGCGMVCFGQSPMPPVAPGFAQPPLGTLPGPAPGPAPVAAPPPPVVVPLPSGSPGALGPGALSPATPAVGPPAAPGPLPAPGPPPGPSA